MPARILIIEDDEFSLDLLTYVVEGAGYTALRAEDGGAGVRMALAESPDLVLCDMQMPVLDGMGVLGRLRGDVLWRRVPVISITGTSRPGEREAVLAAGFDAQVAKPLTPDSFTEKVEAFLPAALRVPRTSPM